MFFKVAADARFIDNTSLLRHSRKLFPPRTTVKSAQVRPHQVTVIFRTLRIKHCRPEVAITHTHISVSYHTPIACYSSAVSVNALEIGGRRVTQKLLRLLGRKNTINVGSTPPSPAQRKVYNVYSSTFVFAQHNTVFESLPRLPASFGQCCQNDACNP